ncbi:MAG: hypothetical protein IKH04_02585, partial [Kiritimatiellae bacterium]|nr:hypothetical protein [Kiritimatiellia bacterium]
MSLAALRPVPSPAMKRRLRLPLDFAPRFARIEVANDKGLAMIEKAATDIYTFENLRKNQYTYVDKTAILKEL